MNKNIHLIPSDFYFVQHSNEFTVISQQEFQSKGEQKKMTV